METNSGANRILHIHGDNVVECERALDWLLVSLGHRNWQLEGPFASAVCPTFRLHDERSGLRTDFTYYPGFGRWMTDILEWVRSEGGQLREAPDVIVTEVLGNVEQPIFAAEFSSSLPAGNQAWQRHGRAYSFAHAGIPYFYVTDLGGYELNADRERKAARVPNPAVPFSYLSFSVDRQVPCLPVFIESPDIDEAARSGFRDVFGGDQLADWLRRTVWEKVSADQPVEQITNRAIELVAALAQNRRNHDTLEPAQWRALLDWLIDGNSTTDYLKAHAPLSWAKTAYIEGLTSSAKALMGAASNLAAGLTSTNLPFSFVPASRTGSFAQAITRIYERIPSTFADWVARERDLVLCWVMGFKPKGDDARPDRGLPPITRMLAGEGADILTIVYGPAPTTMLAQLVTDPTTLAAKNGLWEAVLGVSDAVIVDAATNQGDVIVRLKSDWDGAPAARSHPSRLPIVTPRPTALSEHDVDTVIHLLLSRCTSEAVFEGMCNPPGGDWSGISIFDEDSNIELRWLNLPRVTAANAKRPDHVFQMSVNGTPTLLSIESKERARNVETGIGPRLCEYVRSLLRYQPSAQRSGSAAWAQYSGVVVEPDEFSLLSAAASFVQSIDEAKRAMREACVDLYIGLMPSEPGQLVASVIAGTANGAAVAAYLQGALDTSNLSLTVTFD